MRILALESVNQTASVALLEGNTLRCFKEGGNTLPQSEFLLPAIAEILKETGLSLQDIEGIAVCTGTGSFTGIRIGLSAAYGLSLAANIPLVGVSAFAATAHQCAIGEFPLAVLLESQNTFYVQCFAASGEACTEPLLVTPETLQAALPKEHFFRICSESRQPASENGGFSRIRGGNKNKPVACFPENPKAKAQLTFSSMSIVSQKNNICSKGSRDCEQILRAGNGWAQWGEQPDFSTVVNAETIARAAVSLFGLAESPPFPLPLYVKESYAKLPSL